MVDIDLASLPDLVAVRGLTDAVNRLVQDGWSISDRLRNVRLVAPSGRTGEQLAECVTPLLAAVEDLELRTQSGFVLGAEAESFVVRRSPEPVADYYSGPELPIAERARDGDVVAALSLAGDWSCAVVIDLSRPLEDGNPGVAWRVVRASNVITETLAGVSWWNMGSLLRAQAGPLLCLVLGDEQLRLVTPSFAVVSPDAPRMSLAWPTAKQSRVEMMSGRMFAVGASYLPEELIPLDPPIGAEELHDLLRQRASAMAWAWMANEAKIEDEKCTLEFFGLQRVRVEIGPDGLGSSAGPGSVALYEWVTTDPSPDRVLAVRQVVSIYQHGEFLSRGYDVRQAAEPIYRALRTDTVAEVFAGQRKARDLALTSSQQTADATLAAAKAVGERTLASLGGLGGLVIARAASTHVSQAVIGTIAFGIAVYAFLLALWTTFVEGPGITGPLSAFSADLPTLSDLLTQGQREEVLKLTTLRVARHRGWTVRVLAPLAYLGVVAVALRVAYPSPHWLWP
jgi:hypothetical protein